MREAWLDAAVEIGLRICREAVWYGDRCTWIVAATLEAGDLHRYYYKNAEPTFYDGTAGIAYFLASLCRICDEPVIRQTAEAAIHQTLLTAGRIGDRNQIGFFTGYTGILHLLAFAEDIWENARFGPQRAALLERTLHSDLDEAALDIVAGIAGAVPALIRLYGRQPAPDQKDFIETMGARLIRSAEQSERGFSWKTIARAQPNLTGYSHGAAGILAALLQLYEFLGEDEYLYAAYEAARYENSYFSAEDENWLDLRRAVGDPARRERRPRCANFWCHGAPGIGQSRLEAYRITGDPLFLNDLRRAVRTCLALTDPAGPHNGYSLCHGILGNYELALNARETLPDLGLASRVQAICQHLVDDFISKRIPIPNGIGNSYEIPCFMTGLSGVGYFLLRAYDPELFPSMLLLQPK